MKCPFCHHEIKKVLETRETEEDVTRRRRECLSCTKRFTTYEQVELTNIMVVKKDGKRALFDRQKLIRSMEIACQKRPVSQEQLEKAASEVETELRSSIDKEITTVTIGELVMSKLKQLDHVAYIRFASVYREFQDIESDPIFVFHRLRPPYNMKFQADAYAFITQFVQLRRAA